MAEYNVWKEMNDRPSGEITRLLVAWAEGNPKALDELMPLVYEELRKLAASHMRREKSGHTLQTTALINEVYLKLIRQTDVSLQNRAHFFGMASPFMRRILIDHARAHARDKRGGNLEIIPLDETAVVSVQKAEEFLLLDEALTELSKFDPRKSRIVEMRFFGGLSMEEIAELEKLSVRTVHREWQRAKAWLYRAVRNSNES